MATSICPTETLLSSHRRTGSTTGAHGTMTLVDSRRDVNLRENLPNSEAPNLPEKDSVQYFVLEKPPDYINVGQL